MADASVLKANQVRRANNPRREWKNRTPEIVAMPTLFIGILSPWMEFRDRPSFNA
jgi:hypothetical protein